MQRGTGTQAQRSMYVRINVWGHRSLRLCVCGLWWACSAAAVAGAPVVSPPIVHAPEIIVAQWPALSSPASQVSAASQRPQHPPAHTRNGSRQWQQQERWHRDGEYFQNRQDRLRERWQRLRENQNNRSPDWPQSRQLRPPRGKDADDRRWHRPPGLQKRSLEYDDLDARQQRWRQQQIPTDQDMQRQRRQELRRLWREQRQLPQRWRRSDE